MAKLIYSTIASLDGYVEDASGGFDWAAPDEMVFWETAGLADEDPAVSRDFGSLWRAADKIVFSRTTTSVTSARTRIERDLDPGRVRQLKQRAGADLSVGGAQLAGQALAAGLVDEIQLFLVPVIVGGGKHALPAEVRVGLRLIDTQRFAAGVVYAHYAVED